jgi:cation diffusion facilitator family transporter
MQDAKVNAALGSVAASAVVAAAKFAAALATGSLALLSDALHSLLDVGATLMTLFAVRLSAKPADEQHPYGHGKVESITALIEVGLLVAVSIYVVVEAAGRLWRGGEAASFSWVAVAVLVFAIVVDFLRVRALRRVAAATSSQALEANALHFSADMWQSVLVLAGFAAIYLGFPQGDPLAALGVVVFIVGAAVSLGRRTIDTLMDTAPEGAAERMRAAAEGVRGVIDVERVRARRVGPTTHGDISVAISRTLAPDRIVALKARIQDAILAALPGAEVTVTANPRALSDETLLERVLLIAAARRLPVHHVTFHEIEGRLTVALDLELDGRMSVEAAHGIATKLEGAIREEFGAEVEVETHIEPLDPRGLPGREVPEPERKSLADRIAEIARAHPAVGDVHEVRVRRTERGLVVVLHCACDPKLTIADAHRAIDAFEHEVRSACPGVARVISHAEPKRRVGAGAPPSDGSGLPAAAANP